MIFASAFTAVVAALATFTSAIPVGPVEELVISPQVTYPTANTIWTSLSNQTVTWDTSVVPSEYMNQTGLLLLGYLQNASEHLDINHPLATHFPIGAGKVDIVVPNVTLRDDYIVVLFGDSGNTSPNFTIM